MLQPLNVSLLFGYASGDIAKKGVFSGFSMYHKRLLIRVFSVPYKFYVKVNVCYPAFTVTICAYMAVVVRTTEGLGPGSLAIFGRTLTS